jgi:hypothetical protein
MRYPHSAIGQLQYLEVASRNQYLCTGTLFSERHVLTNAHCIYDKVNHVYHSNWQFVPGLHGGLEPFGRVKCGLCCQQQLPMVYLCIALSDRALGEGEQCHVHLFILWVLYALPFAGATRPCVGRARTSQRVPLAGPRCAVSPGPRLRLFRPVSRPVCVFGV